MKTLRSMFVLGGIVFALSTIGCCPEGDDVTVEDTSFGGPNEDEEQQPFLKAEQECVQVTNNTSNAWCRQYVDEKFVAYFCAREPPEVLLAVPLDDRDNMFCGCTPANGYAACPYNINRDR